MQGNEQEGQLLMRVRAIREERLRTNRSIDPCVEQPEGRPKVHEHVEIRGTLEPTHELRAFLVRGSLAHPEIGTGAGAGTAKEGPRRRGASETALRARLPEPEQGTV